MNTHQKMVLDFHQATGATVGGHPSVRDARLRTNLILEELIEFGEAVQTPLYGAYGGELKVGERLMREPDLVAAADALGDLLYVVYGAGVTFGIDLEPIFAEIHRSNMTKVGGPTRSDGKVLKPDTYEAPNLTPILQAQRSAAVGRILRDIQQSRKATAEEPYSLPGRMSTPDEIDDDIRRDNVNLDDEGSDDDGFNGYNA